MRITEELVKELPGAKPTHWNPNYNGGWFEYSFQVGRKRGRATIYLTIDFGKDPRWERDWMVFLKVGYPATFSIGLWEITTIEEFTALRALLDGWGIEDPQAERDEKPTTRNLLHWWVLEAARQKGIADALRVDQERRERNEIRLGDFLEEILNTDELP